MKLSDYLILIAVLLSFALSVYLWFSGQKESGMFVGLWVPSIFGAALFMRSFHSQARED